VQLARKAFAPLLLGADHVAYVPRPQLLPGVCLFGQLFDGFRQRVELGDCGVEPQAALLAPSRSAYSLRETPQRAGALRSEFLCTLGDQPLKVLVLLPQSTLQRRYFEMRAGTRQHLFLLERFCDVIGPSAGEGAELVRRVAQRADEEHGNGGEPGGCFQAAADLEAVHIRHQNIEHDEIRRDLDRRFQRQPTAGEGEHSVSRSPQHTVEKVKVVGRIVHHHDGRFHSVPLHSRVLPSFASHCCADERSDCSLS